MHEFCYGNYPPAYVKPNKLNVMNILYFPLAKFEPYTDNES